MKKTDDNFMDAIMIGDWWSKLAELPIMYPSCVDAERKDI